MDIFCAIFNLFFAIDFSAVETKPQNFAKNSTPQKNPVIRYIYRYLLFNEFWIFFIFREDQIKFQYLL